MKTPKRITNYKAEIAEIEMFLKTVTPKCRRVENTIKIHQTILEKTRRLFILHDRIDKYYSKF